MATIGTWWRTVRHLKLCQIFGRIAFNLPRPRPGREATPRLRARVGRWVLPARREPSLVGPTRWRFLNEERDVDPKSWSAPAAARLWLYNLHYFDDLNARDAPARAAWHRRLIADWIEANRPFRGAAWEPYPLSLRIVNWSKWFIGGNTPEQDWLASLALQARWLSRRLEVHLLGNHLFANAKALVFAGLLFEGTEPSGWFRKGMTVIERELDEQILDDGGHFERSPMYHAMALEDVLDLINVLWAFRGPDGAPLLEKLRRKAARMMHWLRCMIHPDGHLARFNDTADGVAPTFGELLRYAQDLGVEAPGIGRGNLTLLAESGYIRVERNRALAILDVAPVGPDYLPGHAHADTLSFELSLDGRPLIVNGGTSCYGTGERRSYERGTAAHNTVEVEQRNSSEVWAGFRVGRRARPRDLAIANWNVSCSHDGYAFLPGKPLHRRRWQFHEGDLIVEDEVVPPKNAVARFFLAPGSRLSGANDRWHVFRDDVLVTAVHVEIGTAWAERVLQAQGFGRLAEVDCLVVGLAEGRSRTMWTWI